MVQRPVGRSSRLRVYWRWHMPRVLEQLGFGFDEADPDWSPKVLAADTLKALTLLPAQAAALACDWRGLPVGQVRELRGHKNLTA
ncbi:hypothetical protein [Streptomyces sp. Da 82-17]|uniref:hypothetical protein n=1 Tax=Streptomyces sp. Da 82-17 TaxID=3377116 RepID=UPI0038D381E4